MRVLIGSLATGTRVTASDLAQLYVAPSLPWLRINMVSTVDGAATGSDGRSGTINNEADGKVFHALRAMCDAVVVGAGTARVEGYRPAATPIVVVSRSGLVPELLRGAVRGKVLMATVQDARGLQDAREALGDENVLVLGEQAVDLGALKQGLAERALLDLLCEGGPHLAHDMLAAGMVDEICTTTAPRAIAGDHIRILSGKPLDLPLKLALLLEEEDTLLARWFTAGGVAMASA